MHVPTGLKLDRGSDLFDREACRDGHKELARRDQASNLLDGAGSGVRAVRRRDPVDLCSDGGDALIRYATQTELLAAIDTILNAGRATGELRSDVTAEDIAASLIGIFTVARPPDTARASRLLNILMDGLRPTP